MKVLVHAHTTFSADADISPQELADLAHDRGFDAALISDHFESLTKDKFFELVDVCKSIRTCLMIPGYERNWNGYHVLALGVYDWFEDPALPEWAARVRGSGGITVLAHPARYRYSIPDPILAACDAVEVWNSKRAYEGRLGPNPRALDLLGTRRLPLCGQDIHTARHVTSVSLLLRRCAESREILECIRRGEYRMSNGVFSYGKRPARPTYQMLAFFHTCRGPLVHRITWLRRALRGAAR